MTDKTPDKNPESPKKRGGCGTLATVVFALIVVGGVANLFSCGDHTDPTTSAPTTTDTPERQPAQVLNSLPLKFAEEKTGLSLTPVDLGPVIVDGVNHERGIVDRGNWRVVATCPESIDGSLKVGVIKNEELQVIQDAGQGRSIADNTLAATLECP